MDDESLDPTSTSAELDYSMNQDELILQRHKEIEKEALFLWAEKLCQWLEPLSSDSFHGNQPLNSVMIPCRYYEGQIRLKLVPQLIDIIWYAIQISESISLVGEKQALRALEIEYFTDDVYQSKVKDLHSKYSFIRRTRPDGNCFYRAFGYAYFEKLLNNKSDYQKVRDLAENRKEEMMKMGFSKVPVEDFYDAFMHAIDTVGSSESDDEVLYKLFNDSTISDYVVFYLRLLTSGEIQQKAEFYQNFIEGGRTVAEFCHFEVEPMFKESDHIHIIALSTTLEVGTRVRYMDRGTSSEAIAHDFPDGVPISIHLLYRPGHYDILYPKEDCKNDDEH